MVYKFCNLHSAIATCDSYNYPPTKLRTKPSILRPFTYSELVTATDGFSSSNLLGKGSHGSVFKAVLDGGKLIAAVKRPSSSSAFPAAENEVDILPRIRSPRIVNLIGYAVSNKQHLLLVVDYMPNGSLYDLLHNNPTPPSWRARVRVALQVAEAVRTIHLSDPPVIHRDIKSSNVLLDPNLNARLSDFGLALRGHVQDMRLMSTPPAGTLGYLDPCYVTPDDVSSKCDVFSFGILLLEIITGRRAIDFEFSPPCVLEWALPLIKAGDYSGICDPRMKMMRGGGVIRELALLAVRCVRSTAEKRPPVTQVVEVLKLVYNRMKVMKGVPITWNHLGRRVRRVETSNNKPPLSEMDGVKTTSKKKVSQDVECTTEEDWVAEMATRPGNRTARCKSKSVGSFREIFKLGPGASNCEMINETISVNHLVQQRGHHQVTVKLSSTSVGRLSKSRSMSVLQCSQNPNYQGCNSFKMNAEPEVNDDLDVMPLLLKLSRSKSSSPKSLMEHP